MRVGSTADYPGTLASEPVLPTLLLSEKSPSSSILYFPIIMTAIFHDCISQFIHVYMDDIFIFLCSIEEHERHLGIVFERLHKNHLFLREKADLYSERMECLSHIIDH
jgi:Reverse transcriptase (RNA-dependent DNA polymerase)